MTGFVGFTKSGTTIVAAPSRRSAAVLLGVPEEQVSMRCDDEGLEFALLHPGAIVAASEGGWRVIKPAPQLPRVKLSAAQERALSWLAKGWHAQRSGGSYTVNGTTPCKLETLTALCRLGLVEKDEAIYRATAAGELFHYSAK